MAEAYIQIRTVNHPDLWSSSACGSEGHTLAEARQLARQMADPSTDIGAEFVDCLGIRIVAGDDRGETSHVIERVR